MKADFWGELVGTAILILLGNGVVACVVLRRSYGHAGGWGVITAGWAFAVMAGVFAALAIGSNAHLNPVGCLVWGIGLSLGGTTGYAINPARDFGPRMMHALLPISGKGSRIGTMRGFRSSARSWAHAWRASWCDCWRCELRERARNAAASSSPGWSES